VLLRHRRLMGALRDLAADLRARGSGSAAGLPPLVRALQRGALVASALGGLGGVFCAERFMDAGEDIVLEEVGARGQGMVGTRGGGGWGVWVETSLMKGACHRQDLWCVYVSETGG
jgi:hypothetical protein